MKARIAKLIDVKSIMTLLLTIVFCVLALIGVISGQEFVTIFTVVVGFYFGTQSQKKSAEGTTAKYTGPQQAETVDGDTYEMPAVNAVDEATAMEFHPPDTATV